MVNGKSNTPGSSGASNTPSGSSAGASSNVGGSVAGGSNTSGSPAGGGSSAVAPPILVAQPRRTFRKDVTAMVSGFGTQFPNGSTMTVNGQSMDKSSILAALQAALVLYATVDQAVHAEKQTRVALQAALPGIHQFVAGLKAALIAFFGKGNPVLTAFGLSGTKRHQLTAEQKLVREKKAAQTRELRGTRGSRQKKDVKFTGKVEIQTNVSGVATSGASASTTGGNTGAATPSAK